MEDKLWNLGPLTGVIPNSAHLAMAKQADALALQHARTQVQTRDVTIRSIALAPRTTLDRLSDDRQYAHACIVD